MEIKYLYKLTPLGIEYPPKTISSIAMRPLAIDTGFTLCASFMHAFRYGKLFNPSAVIGEPFGNTVAISLLKRF